MRIKIINLKQSNRAEVLVDVDTGLGLLSGLWKSKHPPALGEDYDVELKLPDPSIIGVLSSPEHHEPGVTIRGDRHFLFRGTCELVYEDGIIVVRIATNWGEMVDPGNVACKTGDWIEFAIPKDQVEFYPIND